MLIGRKMAPALEPGLNFGMWSTRRYITGHDPSGASQTIASPDLLYLDRGGYAISRTYALADVPTQIEDDQDLVAYLSPSGEDYPTSFTHGGSHPVVPGGVNFLHGDFGPGATTPMHRTVSVDFVVVVEGELVLELDSGGKQHLKAGVRTPIPGCLISILDETYYPRTL